MTKYKLAILYISILSIFGMASPLGAISMSSQNYKLEKDSINIGGLDTSESSSFKIFDTIGEEATGESSSANYSMFAGYRQMDEVYIAIAGPSNIQLSPSIGGVAGGTANGNGTWNVKTDSPSGYYLSIKASTSPALKSDNYYFTDYTPSSSGVPDYLWNIETANSEFGFSPFNSLSQNDKYKNNGSACNTGSEITDGKCWYGLSATYEQIANKTERTLNDGENTKISFKAEVDGIQQAGNYTAIILVTAVSN